MRTLSCGKRGLRGGDGNGGRPRSFFFSEESKSGMKGFLTSCSSLSCFPSEDVGKVPKRVGSGLEKLSPSDFVTNNSIENFVSHYPPTPSYYILSDMSANTYRVLGGRKTNFPPCEEARRKWWWWLYTASSGWHYSNICLAVRVSLIRADIRSPISNSPTSSLCIAHFPFSVHFQHLLVYSCSSANEWTNQPPFTLVFAPFLFTLQGHLSWNGQATDLQIA